MAHVDSQERNRLRWRGLPLVIAVLVGTWLSTGFVTAAAAVATGLGIGLFVILWVRRRGVDRIRVRTRYAVAGTLAVIILGTALTEALR
jgi:O-antigen ligase